MLNESIDKSPTVAYRVILFLWLVPSFYKGSSPRNNLSQSDLTEYSKVIRIYIHTYIHNFIDGLKVSYISETLVGHV
jgi:hypothetical protein